jgi:hypothetical protein
MLVNDLKSPGERTKEINRELEANAAEIETLIATAEKEQRSDLSRREQARHEELMGRNKLLSDVLIDVKVEERRSMPRRQTDGSSGGLGTGPTVLLGAAQMRARWRSRTGTKSLDWSRAARREVTAAAPAAESCRTATDERRPRCRRRYLSRHGCIGAAGAEQSGLTWYSPRCATRGRPTA